VAGFPAAKYKNKTNRFLLPNKTVCQSFQKLYGQSRGEIKALLDVIIGGKQHNFTTHGVNFCYLGSGPKIQEQSLFLILLKRFQSVSVSTRSQRIQSWADSWIAFSRLLFTDSDQLAMNISKMVIRKVER